MTRYISGCLLALFTATVAPHPAFAFPAPVITVEVGDAVTHIPLSSQGNGFVSLQLVRLTSTGPVFVGYTDCYDFNGQGCVNALGVGTFTGPFDPGHYVLSVNGYQYLSQSIDFDYFGGNVTLLTLLQPTPVAVSAVNFPGMDPQNPWAPGRVPSTGGSFSLKFRVTNISQGTVAVTTRAVIISDAVTGQFTAAQLQTGYGTLPPGRFWDVVVPITIDPMLPNGTLVCVEFIVHELNRYFRPWAVGTTCIWKGLDKAIPGKGVPPPQPPGGGGGGGKG